MTHGPRAGWRRLGRPRAAPRDKTGGPVAAPQPAAQRPPAQPSAPQHSQHEEPWRGEYGRDPVPHTWGSDPTHGGAGSPRHTQTAHAAPSPTSITPLGVGALGTPPPCSSAWGVGLTQLSMGAVPFWGGVGDHLGPPVVPSLQGGVSPTGSAVPLAGGGSRSSSEGGAALPHPRGCGVGGVCSTPGPHCGGCRGSPKTRDTPGQGPRAEWAAPPAPLHPSGTDAPHRQRGSSE